MSVKDNSNPRPFVWDIPEKWDSDWAHDWYSVENLFDQIREIKRTLESIEKPLVYEISAKQVILNLEKYAYSLSKIIAKKYL